MSIVLRHRTAAPSPTRQQPAWADWALGLGLLIVLAPLALLGALLESAMGEELQE